MDKEKGFKAYLQEHKFDASRIIKFDFEAFDQEDKLRSFLEEQVEQNLDLGGIFVTNSRAYKVASFLKETNRRTIKLVGFDLIQENIDHLKGGYISYLINQNPFKQGYLGVLNIFNHLILKKNVEPIQHLPLDIVVPENIEYYRKASNSLQVVL